MGMREKLADGEDSDLRVRLRGSASSARLPVWERTWHHRCPLHRIHATKRRRSATQTCWRSSNKC